MQNLHIPHEICTPVATFPSLAWRGVIVVRRRQSRRNAWTSLFAPQVEARKVPVSMARAAATRRGVEKQPQNAEVALDADRAVKDLIDNLIVPYMVEEFLRLYGPAAASKSADKKPDQPSNSELDSTP